ncbi:MAG TPA: hypothetical protein VG963_05815, partial [Polyangiaceae bacterium]|nr:hypothetical protein [Polyangiaceae bacterium]
ATGSVAVLGVLSAGAPSCLERDLYVRVEPLLGWIESNLELDAPSDECGALDGRGRCFDGRATYCENGRLRSDTCAGTTSCGFAPDAAGYRCTEQPKCLGDAFGFCDGTSAIRCDETGETARPCDAEGLACGYDPLTGAATCL